MKALIPFVGVRLKAEGYEILHEYAFFVIKGPSVFSLQPSEFFIGIGQPATSRDKITVKGIQLKRAGNWPLGRII